MGFNMLRERSHKKGFDKFKSKLEKIAELLEDVCDDVDEMEEEFGERNDDFVERDNYGRRGDYGERDYHDDGYGERSRGRSRGMMGSRRG